MNPTLPDTSVIICTYTEARWNEMIQAVQSIQQQQLPAKEIIVVVDHNPALFERARANLPGVIVIENQATRGLSGGRNSGIAVAQGQYIAFLDDDATAAPDWLLKLHQHCQTERVLGAGSAVEPVWEGARPTWFPEEFDWVVGCTYRGLPETVAPIRNPLGGAMCVRREIFDQVGGFRENIGRLGTRPVGCEETELCIRATQHWVGYKFIFEPGTRIYHHIPVNRGRWAYFFSRCYSEGLSKAQVAKSVGSSDGLSSERSYTIRTLPQGVLRGLANFLRGDVSGLGRAFAVVAGLSLTAIGYMIGSIKLAPAARQNQSPQQQA